MARRRWWMVLAAVLVVGAVGVVYMAVRTYRDAPPVADFIGPDGEVALSRAAILRGQDVFLRSALMEHGSMFGDGGGRGPDWTADALHHLTLAMREHLSRQPSAAEAGRSAAIGQRVQDLLRTNGHDPTSGRTSDGVVRLSAAHVAGLTALKARYAALLSGRGPDALKPAGLVSDPQELADLAGFFFWGAWVCSAQRPGTDASYTHNWPYDPIAGNTPPGNVLLWSVLGCLALLLGIGAVLYGHAWLGQGQPKTPDLPLAQAAQLHAEALTPGQRATLPLLALAALAFGLQVLAGILTVHDFVGLTSAFGVDLRTWLPLTVVRSWHVQLSVLWIAACWVGASLFVLPMLLGAEPRGQARRIHGLTALIALVSVGSIAGLFLGPHGMLGDWWRLLGHQGWEFVEFGKLWQGTLFAALIWWAWTVRAALQAAPGPLAAYGLPRWLLWAVVAINVLFIAGFVAQPTDSFVVADFWRWCVIHMWVEAFFEALATAIIAAFLVLMGLVARRDAERTVYLATVLFLGSGLLGISHNFYWNAKPMAHLAIGSIFSTLQVVPLVILAVDAVRTRQLPAQAARRAGVRVDAFAFDDAWRFVMAVAFWNFMGAGVFGFIINLPIVNYYEHGTYLTVNHGHAALMGVYGNLALAAVLFCLRRATAPERWRAQTVRLAFWSLNVGLGLMVLLDLLPAGVLQLDAALERGLWYARSAAFIEGEAFQTLTWLRIVGGVVFTLGGVLPLCGFIITRALSPEAHGGASNSGATRGTSLRENH